MHVCMPSLAYIPKSASHCFLMRGEGRESPLIMKHSVPVFLWGLTHPSVKGCNGKHLPLQYLTPLPHLQSGFELVLGKNLVPMKSGTVNVLENTSKQCQQPVIHCKERLNTIPTQFLLSAPLIREHIDLLMLALQDRKTRLSDLCLEVLHSLQEDKNC